MDNDIDAQIRDILMKSTPINDNSTPKPQPTPAVFAQLFNLFFVPALRHILPAA